MSIYVLGRNYNIDHYDLKSGDLKGQIMSLCQELMPQEQISKISIEDLKDFTPNQLELILKQLDFYRDNKDEGIFKDKSPIDVYNKILTRTRKILFFKSESNEPLEESFYVALMSDIDPKIPRHFEVNFKTTKGSTLKFVELENYNPNVIPGSKILLSDPKVNQALGSRHFTNYYRTLEKDDPQTPTNEGIELIKKYLTDEYFPKISQKLKTLGISNLSHLTPKQAIELACFIVMDRIAYSKAQTINVSLHEYKVNDEKAMDDVLREGPDVAENGVCRNYAEITYGVFEALKMMQSEKTSLLNNSYCLINGFEEGVVEGGMVNNHAWNSFVTVTSDNQYHVVVEDPTWADDKQRLDPSRTSNDTDLDYTKERLLITLHRFSKTGVLSIEDEIKGLYLYYLQNEQMKFIVARRILELFSQKESFIDEDLKIIAELIGLFKIASEGYGNRVSFTDALNIVKIAKKLRSKEMPQSKRAIDVLKISDEFIRAYKENITSEPALFALNYIEGKISEAEQLISLLRAKSDTNRILECYGLFLRVKYGFKEVKISDDFTIEDFEAFLPRLTNILSMYSPEDLKDIELEISTGLKNFNIGDYKLFIRSGDIDQNIAGLFSGSVENIKRDRRSIETFLDQIAITHPLLHFEIPTYSTDDIHAVVGQLPQFLAVLNKIPEYNLRGRTLNIGHMGFFKDTGEVSLYKDGYDTLAERLKLDKRESSSIKQKINAALSRIQGELGIINLVISQELLNSDTTLQKLLQLEAILKKIGNKEKYGNIILFNIIGEGQLSRLSSWGELSIALGDSEENITKIIKQLFEWNEKILEFYKEVRKISYGLKIRVSYSKEVIDKLPEYLHELKRLPLDKLYGKEISLTEGTTRAESKEIHWGTKDIGQLFIIYDSSGLESYRRGLNEKLDVLRGKYNIEFTKIYDEVLLNDKLRAKLFAYIDKMDQVLAKYQKEDLSGMIFSLYKLEDQGHNWINFYDLEYTGIEKYKDSKERFNVIQIETTNAGQLDKTLKEYFSLKKKISGYIKTISEYHPDLKLNISYEPKVIAILPKLVEILKGIPREALKGKSLNVVYGYYGVEIEQNSLTVGSLSLENLKSIK